MDVYLVWDDDCPKAMWGICNSKASAEWLIGELQENYPELTFEIEVETVRVYDDE